MIKRIKPEDIYEAAQTAEEWGYPRTAEECAQDGGYWFWLHNYCIIWLHKIPHTPGWWSLHVASAPRSSGRPEIGTAMNRHALYWIAQLLGAARLYSVATGTDPRIDREGLIKYHAPHGWKVDEIGVYIDFHDINGDIEWRS